MKTSLIQGLNEKDMNAVVNIFPLNDFYYLSLFPTKFSPTLTWKAIAADLGIPVAADVVSFNSSAPKKSREIVSRLTGDIPKIEISRAKEESDLNEYYQLLHYANSVAGAQAIMDWIYDDVEFCFKGVNARLEWIALQALSLGKVVLDKTNNAGVITETAVDFLVPAAQKVGVAVTWSSALAATSAPITNIKARVKAMKALGKPVKYMLMDQDTFDAMAISAEVINYCASWVVRATNLATLPSLASVNMALTSNNLPTIVIIDSAVALENNAGTRSVVYPWTTGVITFLPDLNPGNTFYAPLADELVKSSTAIKTMRGHIMIKKYSLEEPSIQEITKGLSNSFPVWSSAQNSSLMYTLATTWTL